MRDDRYEQNQDETRGAAYGGDHPEKGIESRSYENFRAFSPHSGLTADGEVLPCETGSSTTGRALPGIAQTEGEGAPRRGAAADFVPSAYTSEFPGAAATDFAEDFATDFSTATPPPREAADAEEEDAFSIEAEAYDPNEEEIGQLRSITDNPYFSESQKRAMREQLREEFASRRRAAALAALKEAQAGQRSAKKHGRHRRASEGETARDLVFTDRLRSLSPGEEVYPLSRDRLPRSTFPGRLLVFLLVLSLTWTSFIGLGFFMTGHLGSRVLASRFEPKREQIIRNGALENLEDYLYELIPSYLRGNDKNGASGYVTTLRLAGMEDYVAKLSYLMIHDVLEERNDSYEQSFDLLKQQFMDKIDLFAGTLQVSISSGDLEWLLKQYSQPVLLPPTWRSSLGIDDSSRFVLLAQLFYLNRYLLLLTALVADLVFFLLLLYAERRRLTLFVRLNELFFVLAMFHLPWVMLPFDFYLRYRFSSELIQRLLLRTGKVYLLVAGVLFLFLGFTCSVRFFWRRCSEGKNVRRS